MSSYGITRTVPLAFEEALERVTSELQKEGFGVLTTIDVRETLKQKLNVAFPRYIILGACNPNFAYQALQADNQIGLLLPCNIVLQEKNGETQVAAFDPMAIVKVTDNPEIVPIAREVRSRLERVVAAV